MHILVVLGCGRGLVKKGDKYFITPTSHLYTRLMKTIKVFYSLKTHEKIILCSGGGTGEAKLMKSFLLKKGIKKSRIVTEPYSKNTIENCIFSYDWLSHYLHSKPTIQDLMGYNTRNILEMDALGIRKLDYIDLRRIHLHIITNNYHLERSLHIFGYLIDRITKSKRVNIFFHGHPAVTPDNDPRWVQIEKRAMKTINQQLKKVEFWTPTIKDYKSRL